MDDTRPPEPGARLDEQAPLPNEVRTSKRRHWFGAFRKKRLDKIGGRLRVVGPAVQVAPHQPPSPRRRGSITWRVLFGLLKTILFVGTLGAVAAAGLIAWAVYDVPLDKHNATDATPSLAIEAADGTSMGRRGPFKVADVALSDFAPRLIAAVLSIEDRRFYSHPGVDVAGVVRAFSDNITAGHVVEGGSTITQQLVKGMLGDDERTLRRKVREALVAVALELRLGKADILERYL